MQSSFDLDFMCCGDWFLYIASPQQDDFRLSGPLSGQDTSSGARARNRRVNADPRADSLATVPPTPLAVVIKYFMCCGDWFLYIASPQQDDFRFSGPPSGQGTSSGARACNRRVLADLRVDSLAIVPPTPRTVVIKLTNGMN
ncbi:hypothetical protein PoB_006358900 [Plakobranchus ocellatus]|uniref:Uncharacterized protein n=1 Tax=Plakobranchus ocellatus TaxID=259542 RepID=A0AAV4CZ20_9GAST|nr:hypothetical protein PoB_006358900 [Plakobranchus ocellatus]